MLGHLKSERPDSLQMEQNDDNQVVHIQDASGYGRQQHATTQLNVEHSMATAVDTANCSVYDSVRMTRLPKVKDEVEVLWDAHDEWFRGHLVKQRGRVRVFRFDVQYDDGDFLTHDLNEEHWRFADDRSKTYEPGEIEELHREMEEQSFTVPSAKSNQKQSKPKRQNGSVGIGKKREATLSLPDLPISSKRQHRESKISRRNDKTKSEYVLPSLQIDDCHKDNGDHGMGIRLQQYNPIHELTSPVSVKSTDAAPLKSTPTSCGLNMKTADTSSSVDHLELNKEKHLPLRKRRSIRLDE